ncbi:18258_t:CDS:2 [Cetraspora pellucida]|uniref:18258_t:CDS:1 n=1 Tax=Cetraspora pellucida TaxID=1433469 RepID=A0ACA9KT19_9GLOM|nr:18258_t:CDS:2 [Cetraspora pellucida]
MKQVSSITITHCWNKTKILLLEMNLAANTSNNNDIDKLEQLLEELETSYDYTKLLAEKYVNADKEVQTIDAPTEEFVIREILKEQGLVNNKDMDSKNEKKEEVIDNLVLNNKEKKH